MIWLHIQSEHAKTDDVCNCFDEMGFSNFSDDEAMSCFSNEWHSMRWIIHRVASRDWCRTPMMITRHSTQWSLHWRRFAAQRECAQEMTPSPRRLDRTCVISIHTCVMALGLRNNLSKVGETGASCYNFHSKSLFHKNMQARDFFGRDPVI